MKRFIFKIAVFGIILLGLLFIAEFTINNNLRNSKSRMFISWNEIYFGNLQNDVIIIGNSRALVQYSPHILDSILGTNSYNLGFDGSPINRQILKYDAYCRYNKKPKIIIQNIDLWTIGMRSGYEREQFFPYFFDNSLRVAISEYENFNILEQYFPVYRYIGYKDMIKTEFGIKELPKEEVIKKGYWERDLKWDGSKIPKDKIDYASDSIALQLFDRYIAKAYSENIQVIFVYAPIYIGATEKIKNIEGMYKMYDSIAKKYNIPILDYNYDDISYDTTYFYNATHLNKKGAEFFSIKLAHAIDSLGILR